MPKPRHRLATDQHLEKNARITLEGNAAHYLTHVLRLKVGDAVSLFSRAEGEWRAVLEDVRKKAVVLKLEEQTRMPERGPQLTVCFAPIRGGRMETIIEKATELGASVLQPVLATRSVVDKVNLERAESIAREAAEQCERIDWPEIREPVKLMHLLGNWPPEIPLIYGDESGSGPPISEIVGCARSELASEPSVSESTERGGAAAEAGRPHTPKAVIKKPAWAILSGPEGGFTPEEFAALRRVEAAQAVSLGPRILRADTAVITMCALTLAAWGDWEQRPRFEKGAS